MFTLDTPTKAKQTDLEVLSQKNRPADSNPGVVLSFMAERPNGALTELDGRLRHMLYTKSESAESNPQAALDGVEPISELPNLTPVGEKLGRFHWAYKQTGCTLTYDYGTGGASNIVLKDVTVESLAITCKEGGTTTWQWKCEISDVDVQVFGKLATFKNREVSILIAGPEINQQDLDDEETRTSKNPGSDKAWPFPNPSALPEEAAAAAVGKVSRRGSAALKSVGKDATDTFVDAHKAGDAS